MKYSFLLSILLMISCKVKHETKPDVRDKLLGMWKLEIMELKASDTENYTPWKDGMAGFLLYEESGFMSLHLTTKNYPNTDLTFKNFTDTLSLEKLQYITQNYNYMGKFEIDQEKQQVTHHKLSHSNPNEWTGKSVRNFAFKQDTLLITPTEDANAGLRLKLTKAD